MRNHKGTIILLSIVGVVLLVLVVLINSVYTPADYKKAIVYPKINLPDNFADAEAVTYSRTDALPNTYSFQTAPFKVDLPQGTPYTTGSGAVYKLLSSYLVYVTEYPTKTPVASVIAEQFPASIMPDYLLERTQVTLMQSDKGYLNTAFSKVKQEYDAFRITVTDGKKQAVASLMGLDVPTNYNGRSIFVGVATTRDNQEVVDDCVSKLSAILRTLRFDEGLYNTLEKNATQQDRVTQNTDTGTNRNDGDNSGQSAATSDVHTWDIPVTVAYSELRVKVSWTKPNNSAKLELFFPDGAAYAVPVADTKTSTSADFILKNPVTGTYKLNIKGYADCGGVDAITVNAEGT